MNTRLLSGIVAILFLAGHAVAGIPRGKELLNNIPKPLASVEVAYTFPNIAQTNQIVVGEDVTTVITMRNEHTAPVNVSYITGSMNSARAYNIFLHNFTTVAYNSIIPASGESSFEYKFATPKNMPARQFLIALTVFYSDGKIQAASTFLNRTIEVMEPERLVDTEALFLFSTLAAITLAIGYAIYCALKERTWFKDLSKQAAKKAGGVPEKTKDDKAKVDKSDYLVGTPAHVLQRKRGQKKGKE